MSELRNHDTCTRSDGAAGGSVQRRAVKRGSERREPARFRKDKLCRNTACKPPHSGLPGLRRCAPAGPAARRVAKALTSSSFHWPDFLQRLRDLRRHVVLVMLRQDLARDEHTVLPERALGHHALPFAKQVGQQAAIDDVDRLVRVGDREAHDLAIRVLARCPASTRPPRRKRRSGRDASSRRSGSANRRRRYCRSAPSARAWRQRPARPASPAAARGVGASASSSCLVQRRAPTSLAPHLAARGPSEAITRPPRMTARRDRPTWT